jgi:hypothetical protein
LSPVFLTWLWNARGGWREGAGYTPEILAGVQHMLIKAVPGCRVLCISDVEYHRELLERGCEVWPLWETHGKERTSSHGFDCHARLGLYGEPGAELARYLGADVAQWVDADVLIKTGAGGALTQDWDQRPDMYWMPRAARNLQMRCTFGSNAGTWLGLNGSMVRLRLGSRPDWWAKIADAAWVAETEAHICGSDQAALTRLVLEDMGQQWHEPSLALFDAPRFADSVVPWGVPGSWEVAFFPYDPFLPSGGRSNFTKPWLSGDGYLRRQWRVLAGLGTEAEARAECHPGLRRYMGRKA